MTTNSTLRLGRTSATWVPYIQKTISGNGRLAGAGSGYGNHLHLDNGGVLAPGRPTTDDAGTLTVAMSTLENFYFESNSEYRANIVNTNLADLVDIGPSPTYINPGAKLTVKLWTPNAGVPSLTATILTCTNTLTTNQGFAVTWVNTNRWTGLAVNYDTASTPRRVYVTGTYTLPPAAGTVIMLR